MKLLWVWALVCYSLVFAATKPVAKKNTKAKDNQLQNQIKALQKEISELKSQVKSLQASETARRKKEIQAEIARKSNPPAPIMDDKPIVIEMDGGKDSSDTNSNSDGLPSIGEAAQKLKDTLTEHNKQLEEAEKEIQ